MNHAAYTVRMSLVCFVTLGAIGFAQTDARAALVLEVNPAAMTYRVTGSQSLTPFFGDDSDFSQWTNYSGALAPVSLFDGSFATASPDPLTLTRLRLFDGGTDLIVDWGVSDVGPQTVTGNGLVLSYAGASPTQKAYLQSIIGQSLEPVFGHEGDPIAIVGVPEPASAMLLSLGGMILLRRRRRA